MKKHLPIPFILRIITAVFIILSFDSSELKAEKLVWLESRAEALSLAFAEKKMVFLVVGSPDCGQCNRLKYYISERVPDSQNIYDIKGLITQRYVTWASDINLSSESKIYQSGYSFGILPFVALIDPANPEKCMARWSNVQDEKFVYEKLLKYKDGDPDE